MVDQVEALPTAPVAIKPSPLPALVKEDPLTKDQWRTLLAIADTIIPPIIEDTKKNSTPFNALAVDSKRYTEFVLHLEKRATISDHVDKKDDLVKRYLEERPSKLPGFKDHLWRLLTTNVPADQLPMLKTALNLLHYRATALLMTGSASAFADQPIAVRQQILQAWSKAYIPTYRVLYKQLTALIKQNWIKVTPTLYPLLNVPLVPVHGKPNPGFPFEFIQIPPGDDAEFLETDVLVVGSGCGSGPIAKNLAEAGHRVTVVDKGYYYTTEHFPMKEEEGWTQLFMGGGALISDDSSMAIVAGSTWGGGGTVNWSASLQTQGFVRREWAQKDKLPFFTSAEYQDCLDTVCGRMGVSDKAILHNKANDIILEGARRLGWSAKAVPQNTGGSQHYCGYCSFGCASCEKQGPMVTFLPDAAKAGAKFIEGFDVQRVLFEDRNGKKIATGVEGIWSSRDEHAGTAGPPLVKRKVIIKAKRVIISGGTMQSPLILLRSGLKNKWIGRNLRLHPVSFVAAIYDEEIRPWEGGILTAVINEFENPKQTGHGIKIEAATMMPTSVLSFSPWQGGLEYKYLASRLPNMVAHFAMMRDSGSGQVYPDPVNGSPRVVYTPTKLDRQLLVEGTINAARMNYIMGAREIFTTIPNTSTYKRPVDQSPADGVNDPAFNTWLEEVRKRGLPDPDTVFVSAHQMGTCRMSAAPSKGVVDPKGRVWEVDEGLYVADASVFPSASGVNPMVTNMAISEWIARNLIKDLKANGTVQASL